MGEASPSERRKVKPSEQVLHPLGEGLLSSVLRLLLRAVGL